MKLPYTGGNDADYLFYCPGCECYHGVWLTHKNEMGAIWTMSGSEECPTIRPSIEIKNSGCHLYITSGQIEFLNDCTHAFAGRTVPMEDPEC